MQETPVLFLGREDPGIGYPFQYSWAFLVAQTVKEFTCNVEDLGSIPGLGRSPGGGHDNPPQCSHLENPHGQRSLVGYSPWGHRVGYNQVTMQAHNALSQVSFRNSLLIFQLTYRSICCSCVCSSETRNDLGAPLRRLVEKNHPGETHGAIQMCVATK